MSSHGLKAGDELTDVHNDDVPITVDEIRDDGSVSARVWLDQRHGQEYRRDEWTESEIVDLLEMSWFVRGEHE